MFFLGVIVPVLPPVMVIVPVLPPLMVSVGMERKDLVHGTIGERNDVEVAVRPGEESGADAEVPPEEEALALRPLVLVEVVGDPVEKTRVVDGDPLAVAGQLEAEQIAVLEE